MKKIGSISLVVLLTLAVGCGKGNNTPIEQATPEPTQEIAKQQEVNKFVEKDFENFFNDYFSFTDEQLLILNQQHMTTDTEYGKNAIEDYSSFINNQLGKYLADGLKNRLKVQYTKDQINLPKFVLLNNYVVSGEGEVDKIEIKSTRELGESTIYEVAVTTTNKCYPVNQFVKDYVWGDTEGYFTKAVSDAVPMSLQGVNLEQLNTQTYLFSESNATDEMKLEQKFWLTVENKDKLKVESIKTASDWGVATKDKNQVLDAQYINRVAFEAEPKEAERALMEKFFVTLFEQPRSVYDYMETAYSTSAETFSKVFDDLGFKGKFKFDPVTYKAAYSQEMNPYKDEIAVLKANEKTIKITPSVYSTMNQPRFVVTVPVEALHNNNEVVYYSYKYYVGMENGSVEFMQFMGMKPSDQYEYKCGSDEAAVMKLAQEYSVDKDALAEAATSADITLEELITKTKEGDVPNPISVAESIKTAKGSTEQEATPEGEAAPTTEIAPTN